MDFGFFVYCCVVCVLLGIGLGPGLGFRSWLTERRDLDRVSDGGARAVRLDVVDLGRAAPRVVQRQPDHFDLLGVRIRGRRCRGMGT